MAFAHWDRLAEFALDPAAWPSQAAAGSTKQSLPGSINAERNGATIELERDA